MEAIMALIKTIGSKAITPATPAETKKFAPSAPPTGIPKWGVTGKAAQAKMAEEQAKFDKKTEEMKRMWRFWMNGGESGQITFLDGMLDEFGVLQGLTFYEHNLKLNGKWGNYFICIGEWEPCPICEGGDESRLVTAFTIIDHREYKGKKAVYKDTRKLYVCKKGTLEILQKRASKQGATGLAGCTFDLTRTSADEVNVGNDIEFVVKRSKDELIKAYPSLKDEMMPADYNAEIPYHNREELLALGFGTTGHVIGKETSAPGNYNF
jgi:hypothetical protein